MLQNFGQRKTVRLPFKENEYICKRARSEPMVSEDFGNGVTLGQENLES